VTLVDTGVSTLTGARLYQVNKFIGTDRFLCTYGDGLANLQVNELLSFHKSHGKLATVTAVRPVSRFGSMQIDENDTVTEFIEKPIVEKWVNGGFFIFEPEIFNYLDSLTSLEKEPLEKLVRKGDLKSFKHEGFWQPMDTYRESKELNELWEKNQAPWKIW
jgi:glucose-1-phosphate cytidylyltransferase